MSNAKTMYALSLDQCVDLISAIGHKQTVLLQGDMGNGKSAVGYQLERKMPTHKYFYFDCTTKDLGDIMYPKFKDVEGGDCVTMVTNEELGFHTDKPVIINLDEFAKALPPVKTALLRGIYERKMGKYSLPEGSIIFATTNKGSEGVGDILPPHARNRMTVVQVKKTDHMTWIEWGINEGDIDHAVLGWVKDFPQTFHSFEGIKDPEENPYIFHPQAQRDAFVTPRSLELASNIVKQRDILDTNTLTGALIGTIGERGAMDLMAHVSVADDLPKLDDIKKDPKNAKVPTTASAVCMVVYRTLATLEREWLDNWMEYLLRLDAEAQGLFANGVKSPKYSKRSMVMTNKKFTDWARQNNYMFSADKK